MRITDIQNNQVDWESVPGCEDRGKDIGQYLLKNRDILIARTGGTVGKSYLVERINVDAVFASYLIRVVPVSDVDVEYIKFYLESPLYWKQLYEKCTGTGQPNVNGTSLSSLLLSLPPLAEQRRIVAKIDQLMARCDELEKLRVAATNKQTESVFVSIVSLWEIAIKINIGKLTLKTDFQAIEQNFVEQDISILPIEIAVIQTYLNLPLHHRDPFDRILIAQSLDLALNIISCDRQFDAYSVTRLWDI